MIGALPLVLANTVMGRRPDAKAIALGSLAAATAVEAAPIGGVAVPVAAALVVTTRPRLAAIDAAAAAAGAVASIAVFPRVDHEPARGVSIAERRHVEALPDGTGLTVVVNDSSGSGSAAECCDEITDGLPAATIRRFDPESGDDLVEVLEQAAAASVALGVVGGDGTVNLAARIALEAGVPLVVFPGGTLNHFARDLGLDVVADSIEAVRSGQVVAIDVGTIDDRPFVNNASIGSYSELVDERERLEDRLGKWPAMVVALVRVLRRGRRFEVAIDGDERVVWMIFFGNGAYEPAGFAPSTRPDLVDGLVDVRLIDAAQPLSRSRLVAALLLGALARSRVYERRLVNRVTVRCGEDETTRLAADGETFDGPGAFVVGKRPAALLVHVVDR